MAMGGKGRRMAENAIASCRPFKNSTGSLQGTRGSTRDLGWLESHADARRIRELLSRAVYVVWSYSTPIAWVSETEDGDRQAYYVDESHSPTTANHQSVARMGMGEYETIGTRRPVRRPRRGPIERPTPARDLAGAIMAGERAAMRYRTVVNGPEGVEYLDDSIPADSPGYQNGRTESEQEGRLLRTLLDPRYANPDWVPGRDIQADLEAERRDIERVEREGGWRP